MLTTNKGYGSLTNDGNTRVITNLDQFMNTVIKEALNIPEHVTWGGQRDPVFDTLREDFMKPVTAGSEIKYIIIYRHLSINVILIHTYYFLL